jgi:hypothetical protein
MSKKEEKIKQIEDFYHSLLAKKRKAEVLLEQIEPEISSIERDIEYLKGLPPEKAAEYTVKKPSILNDAGSTVRQGNRLFYYVLAFLGIIVVANLFSSYSRYSNTQDQFYRFNPNQPLYERR